MKYIKHYESVKNWTYKYLIDRQNEESIIEDSIFNFAVLEEIINEDYTLDKYLFLEDKILIECYDMNGTLAIYYIKDIGNFLLYLNDPEQYSEIKKFNL